MNWGYKILFVYIAFVAGILLMVFKSSIQKRDLVTEDYYAKELKYQERIDAEKRTQVLSASVKYEIINRQLLISFPKEFSGKTISGTILLYCPSDNNKDFEQPFSTAAGTFTMQLPVKNKGSHKVQISWKADSNSYYFENKLIL
jgi:hypothetical protein